MRILLLVAVATLFILGLVTIYSTTSAEVLDHDLDRSYSYAVVKQIYYACGGIVLALGVWKFGYRRLIAWSPLLIYLSILLLLLTLIPGVGREVNGSKRWIGLFGFSFQPSEFVKYIVPAYIIHRYLLHGDLPWTLSRFLSLIAAPVVVVGLILIEPNNGTAFVIAMTIVVLCLLMCLPAKFWALPLCALAIVGALSAYHLPYVTARLQVYMHPELDLKGKGHQPFQAKIAAGSGGVFGRGPGNSLQKLSYLPEAQNDYIAAIYAEEFGFVGILALLFLYSIIAHVGFVSALQATDPAGFYLGGTVLFLICFQAFLNLGVVSGLLPSTGLNLPFFSQGGSSLMANIVGVSLLLQLSPKT
jgi:cell division protein FtsW